MNHPNANHRTAKLGGLTLTYGMKEHLALSKMFNADLLKGTHWIGDRSESDLVPIIHVLARRAHPDITEQDVEDLLGAPTEVIEALRDLVGDPQTAETNGGPSAASTSA
jgi:hypothetical protein